GDTLFSLAEEDVHPPMYFVLLGYWTKLFGNSILITRSFSVICSIFSIFLTYMLCWELFKSPLISMISSAIVSISPFHILFAQEARMYSLMTLMILLASTLILRSMRLRSKRDFLLYSLCLPFGLLTHYFFVFVVVSHGLYVVIHEKFKPTKLLLYYALSLFFGLVSFLSWLRYVQINSIRCEINASSSFCSELGGSPYNSGRSLLDNLVVQFGHLRNIFIDLSPGDPGSPFPDIPFYSYISIFLVFSLILYSFYSLICNAPRESSVFIITMACSTMVPVILSDMLSGSNKLMVFRYQIPSYLAIQVSVAFLIAQLISTKTEGYRKLGQYLFVFVTLAGFISCVAIAQADTWWLKTNYPPVVQLTEDLKDAEETLFVSYSPPDPILHMVAFKTSLCLAIGFQRMQSCFFFQAKVIKFQRLMNSATLYFIRFLKKCNPL
ncbi:MAG: phospholipid carrier-dependent glycosyltransferase, partial [Coleofasciculaceae cyanobacterium SM2_3_26]|nr:phospholipid carrier-dependent glycosyltransferase [Coleofasciculaceae cyanobacterium SM2_3_26]